MTEYRTLLRRQRAYYQSGRTRSYSSRIKSLDRMYRWIEVHEKEIEEALRADLGKAAFEAYATEIGIVKEEIRFHQKHLRLRRRFGLILGRRLLKLTQQKSVS